MLMILTIIFTLFLIVNSQYQAVDELDLNKYIGEWYEVYGDNFDKTFQGDGKCIKAFYKFNDYNVSVFNSQLDKENKLDTISGFAYYKGEDTGGYLTVQLEDLPEAPYWVIELGPVVDDFYDYSIVSDNLALSLFVLTRNVTRFYQEYNELVLNSLKDFGFDRFVNKPYRIDQECQF
tara:strand:- start:1020 stop:1550 length:531 start_codon:yes stop_codon:yes gene_type:complete